MNEITFRPRPYPMAVLAIILAGACGPLGQHHAAWTTDPELMIGHPTATVVPRRLLGPIRASLGPASFR